MLKNLFTALAVTLLLASTVLLGGCGGGDAAEDEGTAVHTPSVDCKARPELCR